MPIQVSAYLKAVIRNIVYTKRKGKAGIKRKQSASGSTATNNSVKEQREEKGRD